MKAEELLRRCAAGERNFRGVNLNGASLTKANLRQVNLSEALLTAADLTEVDLEGYNNHWTLLANLR